MIKKNLLILGKLLAVMLIEISLIVITALVFVHIGMDKRSIVLLDDYLMLFVFTCLYFRIARKAECIKYCITAIILGVVLLACGIFALITGEPWYNATFRYCTIHSMAIFLGILFRAIQKN